MVRMPSWNIHTAHVERLLDQEDPAALGIRDVNAFLFGNLVPDIYVGYMVADLPRTIEYRETHFADPGHVPEAHYWEFFERFALPGASRDDQASDVVLGAWAHLVADNVYNRRTNAFRRERGIPSGTETRIKKQADFALFGHTLRITMTPAPTDALLAQAEAFPQYAIDAPTARAACEVMADIVRENTAHHITGAPAYQMLSAEFFASTMDEADRLMRAGLHAYAAGEQDWGRERS